MKLILLPGMDGTGMLFAELLSHINMSVPDKLLLDTPLIIPLARDINQDYESLVEAILKQLLPFDEIILLAESFSCRLALDICSLSDQVRGVIFVAGFLAPVEHWLLPIAQLIPITRAIHWFGADFFIQRWCFNKLATPELLDSFKRSIEQTGDKKLKARLRTLSSSACQKNGMSTRNNNQHSIPALFIYPLEDKLIQDDRRAEFHALFPQLIVENIAGPHFVLQTHARPCAQLITHFIHSLK